MIVNIKAPNELSSFAVVFYGSASIERRGIRGITHLMEHLCCKALDPIMNDLDRDGITWNACTGSTNVVFYIQGLEDSVAKYRDVLVDAFREFNISKEDFEKERAIVLDEYLGYFNDQSYSHYLNFMRKHFNFYDALGSGEDLRTLTYEDCLENFRVQYSKPSKIVNVSVNEYHRDIEFAPMPTEFFTPIFGEYEYEHEHTAPSINKTSIIAYREPIEENTPMVSLICNLLAMGLQSPLYQEVREKRGLVYGISMHGDHFASSTIPIIMTTTSNENVEVVMETIKEVMSNPDKYLTKERFETVVDYLKVRKKVSEIEVYKDFGLTDLRSTKAREIVDTVTYEEMRAFYDKYFNELRFSTQQ